MKKLILVLLVCICFFGCKKNKTNNFISSEEISSETSNLRAINETKTPKVQTLSEELNIYAVNSFEGLRVRSTPSVEGEKIGLLEYQETVECISIEKENIVLDGISSSWYKVKSIDKDLEGYVFGGYLTPLHSVNYPSADKNQFVVDSEKLLSLIDTDSGIETDWNLEDGIYLPAQLCFQYPKGMNLDREICGIVINNGKIYFFYSFNEGETFAVNGNSYETYVDSFYKPEIKENEDTQTEFVVYINERSGGGECQTVSFNGKNLVVTFYANNFALVYRASYILEKTPSDNKTIKTKYSYSFPYFANIKEKVEAYSSVMNLNESDISIIGNQREILYDDWGPLSDEGERNILELTDLLIIDDVTFYKGIYRGKEVYIKKSDLTEPLYVNKKLLEEAISFEYGL